MGKNISLPYNTTNTRQYQSGRRFCSKNNETEGGSQIQSIFFRVGTTFRVGARLRRLGYKFGLHAHPHTGKQLSPVAGFAGGPSTARSDDNDNDDNNNDRDDDDDDEGAYGLTSPTVADVRRRARQSTCHATPGSFELIAKGLLSRLYLVVSRHRRTRRFHHTPVFWSVSSRFSFFSSRRYLLTPAQPALFLTPFLLALYWLRHLAWNETRRDASGTVPMHLVSFSLESAEVLHRMGMARGKWQKKKWCYSGLPFLSPPLLIKELSSRRFHFFRNAKVQ